MNATAATSFVNESPSEMPLGRVLSVYIKEARYDVVQMLRSPGFAVPFLVLPAALYVLFAVALAGESPETRANPEIVATYLLAAFCTFGVMGPGLFGFGVSLAIEREQGLLKLKRALPVPLGAHLAAKMVMSLAFGALAAGAVVIAAFAFDKVVLDAGALLALVGVLVLGAIPFCAIGMLIGAYSSASAAPAYVNLVYLPGMYLSGMFFPLPEFLRPWAVIWPAFHLNQTALGAAGVKELSFVDPTWTAAVLVGMTVLCGGLALRRLARVG